MSDVNNLGVFGERLAFDFLISEGYKILAQNYRFKKAEVDILAQKGTYLVAVEVKTRRSKAFGAPEEFLKPAQIQRIIKAVDHFVVSNNLNLEVRFDIIAIIKTEKETKIEHLEDAFLYF